MGVPVSARQSTSVRPAGLAGKWQQTHEGRRVGKHQSEFFVVVERVVVGRVDAESGSLSDLFEHRTSVAGRVRTRCMFSNCSLDQQCSPDHSCVRRNIQKSADRIDRRTSSRIDHQTIYSTTMDSLNDKIARVRDFEDSPRVERYAEPSIAEHGTRRGQNKTPSKSARQSTSED